MSAINATTSLPVLPVEAADWLNTRRIKRIAWSIIGLSLAMLIVSFSTAKQGRTVFGTNLGGDWLAFHNAATILNTAGPTRLYDTQLQQSLFHTALPDEPTNVSLPYANAPFLAKLIQPLAKAGYGGSFAIWTVLSIAMFFAAIALAWRAAGLSRQSFWLALLVCCSFEPFAFECIHGGQISCIGLLVLTAAAFLHLAGWPIVAGISLAVCIYKPTLLPIVLIMLVATRQWRVLAGFGYGAVVIVAISLSRMGGLCWLAYAKTLISYANQSSSPANEAIFRTWKFVDLNSFLKLLGASPRWIAVILVAIVAGLYRWMSGRVRMEDLNDRRLAWAIALSGTLVSNVYVGIYDSILILPALILTAGVIRGRAGGRGGGEGGGDRSQTFESLCAMTYILPWCSQFLARQMGFQPYTLALAAVAIFQSAMLQRRRVDVQNIAMESDNAQASNPTTPMMQL